MAFYKRLKELKKQNIKDIAKDLWHSEYNNYEIDTTDAEYQSWLHSLPLLINSLYNAGLGELDLIMEYTTPLDSRIDAILVGYSHEDKPCALLIEDKQWSDDNVMPADSRFVVDVKVGQDFEERTHPLYQLHSYSKELSKNHSAFKNDTIIKNMAFVHNMDNSEMLLDNNYSIWKHGIKLGNSTLIGKNDYRKLVNYVSHIFQNKNNNQLTEQIINGQYVLGKAGLNGFKRAIYGKENALMIKDQAPVNTYICDEIEGQIKNPHKEMIVVSGTAGTGKTILGFHAICAYHEMLKMHNIPTNTEDALYSLSRNRTLKSMIDNTNNIYVPYVEQIIGNRKVNFLVIDEAHRMPDVADTLTKLFNSGVNIILILQDDWQVISAEDSGLYANFSNYAYKNKIDIKHKYLKSQLRTGLDSNLNQIIDKLFTNNTNNQKPKNFNLKIEDSLEHMEHDINGLSQKGLTKWIAPFCWEWSRNSNYNDVRINDHGYLFSHPWNPSSTKDQYNWLSDNQKVNEIASIYTSQGIDLDYSGFIWWDDLRWDKESQQWIFNLNKCKDYRFKKGIEEKYSLNIEQVNKNQDPKILKLFFNIYKVLLTRARKGTLIWFKDKDTENYVKSFFY